MSNIITLVQLAAADSPVSSTVRQSLAGGRGKAHSFSMPSFLYYALKAKYIARFKCPSESEAKKKIDDELYRPVTEKIRDLAKSVYADLKLHPEREALPISSLIQSRMLNLILDEPDLPLDKLGPLRAVSINSSRSGKNITIPSYLLDKLGAMLGNEQAARSRIHEVTFLIKSELADKKLISSDGSFIGDAAKSTWSRKVHNALFLDLIQLSNIPEINGKHSMLDVKIERDIKLEI